MPSLSSGTASRLRHLWWRGGCASNGEWRSSIWVYSEWGTARCSSPRTSSWSSMMSVRFRLMEERRPECDEGNDARMVT